MSWSEARDETVRLWEKIRSSLGSAHPTDLLTDINLICPLCDEAAQERTAQGQPDADACAFCIAYQQAGGCREVCAEISTRIAEKDWDAAWAIADDFIAGLRALDLPVEGGRREGPG